MKFLFFTGSRSEWGYIKPFLRLCKKYKIDYNICATNMHLLDSFGNSVKEIEKEGFKVSDKVYMALDGYNHYTMAKSMGIIISSFTDILQRVKPSWVILAGDRSETLSASLVAAYTYTPIAHIQAGELSGNIDGLARHAIGKFAHLHFGYCALHCLHFGYSLHFDYFDYFVYFDYFGRFVYFGWRYFELPLLGSPNPAPLMLFWMISCF